MHHATRSTTNATTTFMPPTCVQRGWAMLLQFLGLRGGPLRHAPVVAGSAAQAPWLARLLQWLVAWGLVSALVVAPALAQPVQQVQGVQKVPTLSARVVDLTATLTQAQAAALEQKLAAFEQSRGTQIVVLMVATTAPEDIAAYANRVASEWKIGRREVGDGLLLIVAKDDRKLRIEVARALEGAVPDLLARRVIDQHITPRFKQGDFAGGVEAGVDQLIALVSGENLPTPGTAAPAQDANPGAFENALYEASAFYLVIAVFLLRFGGFLAALTFTVPCGLVGLIVSGVVWSVTRDANLAFWGAMAGIPLGIMLIVRLASGAPSTVGSGASRSGSARHSNHHGGSGWGSGAGGLGGGAGMGGGGFGSGGGGSFGGGGASGDW